MSYRGSNEGFYATGYWRRWPREDIWLDNRIRLNLFRRWLRPGPAERLLDLAGGAGNFSERLSSEFGQTVLTDIALEALRQNRQPGVARVQGDLMALPFQPGAFSRVLLSDVLEHLAVKDLSGALEELHRVCRPGAIVVVFTNCRGLRLRPLLLRVRGRRGEGELDWKDLQDGHLNRLSDEALSELVGQVGFRIVRKRFFSHVFEPLVTAVLDVVRRSAPSESSARSTGAEKEHRLMTRMALKALTGIMALDLILLGRVPGGGVFLALERRP